MTQTRRIALVVAVAAGVRLLAVLLCDREVADVLRYRKVADHVRDVSWNPYQAARLHPYPPVWFLWEAASGWLDRHASIPFAVVVKLPPLLAELALVALLAGRSRGAAWVYALHPVSLLVTGAHGQFDALALVLAVLAIRDLEQEKHDRSALALSGAVALKSFPVLLLPVVLLRTNPRAALRYAALCLGPVALLLLPFALHDFGALRRELIGYGGVADFGWIGLLRGLGWLGHGVLSRADAMAWGGPMALSKLLFLGAYAALVAARASRRLRMGLTDASLAVLLAFLVFYGALSAQYLLWPIVLGVWARVDRDFVVYSLLATVALLGFYPFLAPGVLFPRGALSLGRSAFGALWVVGTASVLMASAVWLVSLLRRGSAPA